jgi:oligoendopeptidase F
MDLGGYRRSAESFVSELTAAYYRHYAGLDERFEIEPVYERHARLFDRTVVVELRELADESPQDGEDARRLRMLLDFAVEGYIGQATKALEAEIAAREAAGAITVAGEEIGFRQAAVLQANEPDPDRRAAIEHARFELVAEQLNPLHRELADRRQECARVLGYANYRALCEQTKDLDLDALAEQTAEFTRVTDAHYPEVLDPELERTLGFGLSELRRSDLPRFFRAPDDDRHFPADRLLESLLETLRPLGISNQDNVILDVDSRPNKSPRAFCAPVRVPQEVYLVIAPVGGRDDFAALFHEAGHTEHYAHVDDDLAFEFRYLGDNSITEAFAFLFQHLTEDPLWLAHRLEVGDADELATYARAHRLVYLRRYAAKLAYELELHGQPDSGEDHHAERYASLLGDALSVSWSPVTYLSDVDPGFYCACYLRAWALETHLREYLRERHGPLWFESRAAGDELVALWHQGQRSTPDELLTELTGGSLDFRVLLGDLGF